MAKVDVALGQRRKVQIILWSLTWEDLRWHWALKVWRWPTGQTLRDCEKAGMVGFGFRALTIGPLEFRYWPNASAVT